MNNHSSLNTAYDPEVNPSERKANNIKQEFSNNVAKYVKYCANNGVAANIILLLCPAYPFSDNKFNYEKDELMSDSLPPVLPKFINRIDTLLYASHLKEHGIPKIYLKALVCDIESDLPNVVNRFANGSIDYFNQCVQESSQRTEEVLKNRYPYLHVKGSTFTEEFPALSEIQLELQNKVKDDRAPLPIQYQSHLSKVVEERGEGMFKYLYGATNFEEKYALAQRQMINYLAVTKAVALTHTRGALILNTATPNSFYVNQSNEIMRGVLGLLEDIQVPNYHFFK
jgi:hypothetical protein